MEEFVTGYCRSLDKSRIVTVDDEDGTLRADCAYRQCPYRGSCEIARRIDVLLADEKILVL